MNPNERIRFQRNLGVIAHIDAGKTTTTERILYFSGTSHKIGEVDDGTAVMDWMEQERERGITITSAVTSTPWRKHVLNIVDTPGHVDFTAEVQRSLRVLDGAVVVVCGVGGVEPQSEMVWHQASEFRVPRIVFVNKLDRMGADFDRALADLEKKLEGLFVPLLLPLFQDRGYPAAVDILRGKMLTWDVGQGDDAPTESEVPDDLRDPMDRAREKLIEAAALSEQSILDDFLESGTVDHGKFVQALRRAVLEGRVHPVLCGSALKNRGIRILLDAIVDYLPSPLDMPAAVGLKPGGGETERRSVSPTTPLSALVYKVRNDESHNRLFYTRVYSGTLSQGDQVWNATRGRLEKITRVYRMHSSRKETLEQAVAGDIVALVGPKETRTGDTLCPKSHPILLEQIRFPEPVISVAIEPRSLGSLEKLEKALNELAVEDPTFEVRNDSDTGQMIISGMGELHIEVLVGRLLRDFRVEARTGKPQIAYRETLRGTAKRTGRFEKQIASKLHQAVVTLQLQPSNGQEGFEFKSEVDTERLLPDALAWIEDTAVKSMASGPFAGYPLMNVSVTLTGVDLHTDAATEIAVRGATAEAFRASAAASDPVLVEPVVRLEVIAPGEYTGEVLKDLGARRAHVTGTERRGLTERVVATVPLSVMFGYATDFRSLTHGRGTFSMEISHFELAAEAMKRFRG